LQRLFLDLDDFSEEHQEMMQRHSETECSKEGQHLRHVPTDRPILKSCAIPTVLSVVSQQIYYLYLEKKLVVEKL